MPVQALVMKHHRNPEPRVLFHPCLHGVGVRGHLVRSAPLTGPRNLTQSVFHQHRRALREKIAFFVYEHRLRVFVKILVLPRSFHLRHFFFERHAREQVGNALFDRHLRVAIRGNLLRLLPRGERRHQYKRAQPTNGGHYEAARKTRFHRVSPDGIGWNDLKTAATIPRPLTFTLSVFWVFSDAPFAAPFSFFQRWDITKAGAFNGESLALLTAPGSPPPSCAPDPLRPSRAAL